MIEGVFVTPRARQDIVEAALYIADNHPAAADRFLDAVEATLGTLANMPRIGAPREFDYPALTGLRLFPVSDFERYVIFYRPRQTGIEIIRVLHGHRDIDSLFKAD